MKILRIAVLTAFVISCISYYAVSYIYDSKTDHTYPRIQCDTETLEADINDKEKLFEGISVYDEKDGDLSDQLVIESISRFIEKGICNITYAVSDSDNNVAKYTRKIKYKDYISPKFTLYDEPAIYMGSYNRINEILGAFCIIDGDISDKIKYDYGSFNTQYAGVYEIKANVTNSKGDVAAISFDVYVRERNAKAPYIQLTQYITYIKSGEEVDAKEYIADVHKSDGITAIDISQVDISTDLNTEVPGNYKIIYSVEDGDKTFTVSMLCVVEE